MKPISINLTVPASWAELSQKQLRYVFSLFAAEFNADEIKALALLRFSGCTVIARHDGSSFLLKHGKQFFTIKALTLAEVLPQLGWLDELPPQPVRLVKIRRHRALAADFQGVPFEVFIVVENLFQGYLSTNDEALLTDLAKVLYPGLSGTLTASERVSVFYWVAALKQMLARRFADFFQPLAQDNNLLGSSPNIASQLQESVDAEIRALTKGDITKEREILSLDTWRALTELNAQAKEFKQLNAQIHASK